MKIEVNKDYFTRELEQDVYASWSYEAIDAIWEYYQEFESCSGEDAIFDIAEIRCNFSVIELEEFNALSDSIRDEIFVANLDDYDEVLVRNH